MSERRFRLTPGGVSSVGLLVVWCPMYRRRIVGGRVVRRLSAGLEGSLTSAAGKSWLRQCCPTTRTCLCEWARPSVVRALIGAASHGCWAESFHALTATRWRCGRRRISLPRTDTCRSRRCAVTSSTGGRRRWGHEARVRVSVAPDRTSACWPGGMCRIAPRALQRRAAGAPGWLGAQQEPHLLRGPVGATDRDPGTTPGYGAVVVFQPAGHVAPVG